LRGGRQQGLGPEETGTRNASRQSGPLCPTGVLPAHSRAGSYAGTVTSAFLSTGTLLDPEGLYDEEVSTPDNLQKYAIPNPPTDFRQFLKKPVHCLLFNISQVEGGSVGCKKKKQTQM